MTSTVPKPRVLDSLKAEWIWESDEKMWGCRAWHNDSEDSGPTLKSHGTNVELYGFLTGGSFGYIKQCDQ